MQRRARKLIEFIQTPHQLFAHQPFQPDRRSSVNLPDELNGLCASSHIYRRCNLWLQTLQQMIVTRPRHDLIITLVSAQSLFLDRHITYTQVSRRFFAATEADRYREVH
jgi:hypothetical protein